MARTKDEKLIINIYEAAKNSGSVFNPVNRYTAGLKAGLNPKGVETACRLLAQANFIKPASDTHVALTDHGKNLVEDLLKT